MTKELSANNTSAILCVGILAANYEKKYGNASNWSNKQKEPELSHEQKKAIEDWSKKHNSPFFWPWQC